MDWTIASITTVAVNATYPERNESIYSTNPDYQGDLRQASVSQCKYSQ